MLPGERLGQYRDIEEATIVASRAVSARRRLRRCILRTSRGSMAAPMSEFERTLYRRVRLPGLGLVRARRHALLLRVMVVGGLILFTAMLFWLDRDGLKDTYDGHVSFGDVLYFTMVTLTTVGYGDIVPVTPMARLIDAFAVTPIRLLVWFIFIGTAYELLARNAIEAWRMQRLKKMLKNHSIICGYGRTGQVAVNELLSKGVDTRTILVLDARERSLLAAADAGLTALRGDPTHASSLSQAGIADAKAVIFSLARDDTTALAVLTARQMAPDVRIIALVRDEENVSLLQRAGADLVIHQGRVNGFLLADAVDTRFSVGFMIDLMTCRGRFNLSERRPLTDEIGQALGSFKSRLIVGLERDGSRYLYSADPEVRIRADDLLLVIDDRKVSRIQPVAQ